MLNTDFGRITIGLNKFFDELDHWSPTTKNITYPPYNIIDLEDDKHLMEIAVAGFSQDELDVSLNDRKLVIKGTKKISDDEPLKSVYRYKGISSRSFENTFLIGNDIVVKDVKLENGILGIFLERIVPEERKPKTFKINYVK